MRVPNLPELTEMRSSNYESILRMHVGSGDRQKVMDYIRMVFKTDSYAAFYAAIHVGDSEVIQYVSEELMKSGDYSDWGRAGVGFMILGQEERVIEARDKIRAHFGC
jgi:hypothetical protein